MVKYCISLFILLLSVLAGNVHAQSCSDMFPDALSNSDAAGSISFGWGAYVSSSPDNILATQSLSDGAGPNTSCNGVSCSTTTSLATAGDFSAFVGGAWTTIPSGFFPYSWGAGNYGAVTANYMGFPTNISLEDGVYNVDGDFTVNWGVTLDIPVAGTAVIYVDGNVNINSGSITTSNASGYVFIYATGNVTVGSSSTVDAVIYSEQGVTVNNAALVTGAITAEGAMTLISGSQVAYDSSAVTSANFDGFCSSGSGGGGGGGTPNLVGEWRLEESSWDGTANEVVDESGNDLHGTAINYGGLPSTQTTNPAISGNPGTCGSGDFTASNGHVQINDPGAGSLLDLSAYSVTAWVYARSWASGDRATIVSKDENFEFHLENDGQVRWWWTDGVTLTPYDRVVTSAAVPLNEWHHIAITYEVGNQVIYIDGVAAATASISSPLPMENDDPLLIGRDISDDSTRFDGLIDEVRLYDGALSSAEVATVMNETHTCLVAPSTPAPLAEWRMEETAWDGTADEVVDESGNDFHATAVSSGGFPITASGDPALTGDPGSCGYGDYNAFADGYLQVADDNSLDLTTHFTISAWINPQTYGYSGPLTIIGKGTNYGLYLDWMGRVYFLWGPYQTLFSTGTIPQNEWHHIAVTYTNGSQIIYIDGVANATANDWGGTVANANNVQIGAGENFLNGFYDQDFEGYIDEVRIFDQVLSASDVAAVMAETHACATIPAIDHFVIDIGGGSGSTCAAETITITAEDSSNNTVTDYSGTIAISTSTGNGDWSVSAANGTLTPGSSDSGSASYSFDASDSGVIALDLSNTHAETLSISVNDSTNAVTTTSGNLSFSENAFVVTTTDSLGNDVIAGRSHDFHIEMYRQDPSTGICSVATNYNVADVKAWLTRAGNDPGGAGPQVTNAAASDTETLANSEPGSANFTLAFVNGEADFTLLASDVGAYAINFLDDGASFSDQDISGSSATQIARPFGIHISAASNPGAANASGSVFTTAGNDFTVNVSAVGWSSADDSNNDGVADGHDDNDPSNNADLSDNTVLLSFGSESPAEEIELSSVLIQPSGGTDAGLANSLSLPADGRVISSFASGAGSTSDVHFAEVGIIEIAANIEDGDYLGSGSTFSARIESQSSYVGRFIPAAFVATAGSVTEACTSGLNYSYMGEAFELNWQLQAQNALGAQTTNYDGSFVKLDASNGSLGFGALDEAASTALSSRLSHNATSFSWSNGQATLSSNLQLERASSPDGPYDQLSLGANAIDTDSVSIATSDFDLDVDNDASNDHVNLGQTEVRFGRLFLGDAFGPETANLPVSFQTEYWDGSVWVSNTDDSCTVIALSAISYPDGSIDTAGNRNVTVGSGSSTGTYSSLAGSAVNFSNGDAGHYFTAPGSGNMGEISVDVDLTLYPWLRFDWDQDGSYSDTALPTATFTFGSYRGHDRVIFWQEILKQ